MIIIFIIIFTVVMVIKSQGSNSNSTLPPGEAFWSPVLHLMIISPPFSRTTWQHFIVLITVSMCVKDNTNVTLHCFNCGLRNGVRGGTSLLYWAYLLVFFLFVFFSQVSTYHLPLNVHKTMQGKRTMERHNTIMVIMCTGQWRLVFKVSLGSKHTWVIIITCWREHLTFLILPKSTL